MKGHRVKMSDKPPSLLEWKALYDAATEFKKTGCWDWMWDSDLFGVQNPVSGEIGYCCVMGRRGEHFALGVYLGTEGVEGYLRMLSSHPYSSPSDVLHLQKCLMASFEDRKFLDKRDMRVIKKLGLKFRGSNSWPLFRNYLPGYHPWYLSGEEAEYLTLALQQAIDVSLRFKNDPGMLDPKIEDHYFVRVPEKEKGGLIWRDEWLKPPGLEKAETIPEPINVNRLEKIRKMIPRRRGVWEIDFFYHPNPVQERGERPYYPYVMLWVDHYSGMILAFHLARHARYKPEFIERFLELAENTKVLPKEIFVKKEETFKLLEPLTSGLGIELSKMKRLMELEEAKDSMFDFFRKR
ncbi:MAG: hypothetical protein A7316_04490 [Candidatus Altiarchaeales archaeon WOR_SM1_86-2]|nr:MAG: hypothetical protein A7316_04490 [Candidatus Altiarchaeales archaeon WOR_SM1_86-2]ODS37844.1 MAG: hypothetical protein A7315_03545 [Candidatus Altiarchaeales archaeon WOR_SM1_79]